MKKDKDDILFTVRLPISAAGLNDKIHALTTLYCLGKACSFTYVHTPFDCPRSYPYNFILSLVEKTTSMPLRSILSQRIIKFLGLDRFELNIDKKIHHSILEVNLEEILLNNNLHNISQLKSHLLSLRNESNRSILVFTWTYQMYSFANKLYSLLAEFEEFNPVKEVPSLKLSENYWEARKKYPICVPFDDTRVKIVIHIRKGDVAPIILKDGTVLVEEPQEELFKSGDTKCYFCLLEKIFDRFDSELFSVIVLSDGYRPAFREVRSRIRKRKLSLSPDQKNELFLLEKQLNSEFDCFLRFKDVSVIIDGTEEDLFKSIHALACADVLIYGGGGFSRQMHRYFKVKGRDSVLISIKEDFECSINHIEHLLQKKGLVV
jgi:hypothetical protein